MPTSVRELITGAQVLLGTERTLSLVPDSKAERHVIPTDLNKLVSLLEAAGNQQIVMLIHGDPMFYGLARYVCDRLGKDRFEVVPHVSSMQLAFARVMETWEEAYLTNLANHPLDAVLEKIRTAQKVGLFTTDHCGPADVAKSLLARHIDYFTAYVCENLGARDERVTRGSLAEIASQKFDPLNVMILVPTGRGKRSAAGCSATPTRRFCNRNRIGVCSRPLKSARLRSLKWTSPRRAPSGTSAPAAAR
jgi:precorrin-6Y C5,15-methyltransferase (decarboxylating)